MPSAAGRCSGVCVELFQVPCRSGRPSAVLGTRASALAAVFTAGAYPDSMPARPIAVNAPTPACKRMRDGWAIAVAPPAHRASVDAGAFNPRSVSPFGPFGNVKFTLAGLAGTVGYTPRNALIVLVVHSRRGKHLDRAALRVFDHRRRAGLVTRAPRFSERGRAAGLPGRDRRTPHPGGLVSVGLRPGTAEAWRAAARRPGNRGSPPADRRRRAGLTAARARAGAVDQRAALQYANAATIPLVTSAGISHVRGARPAK